jgi:hypothetical protein
MIENKKERGRNKEKEGRHKEKPIKRCRWTTLTDEP